ncbi:MAG: hypothetical protein RBR15_15605 [Sphaerochaeta sp.]|nr:hypothetical protein [Sphaerochaeta sp.]
MNDFDGNGVEVGVENADQTHNQISNAIRESIVPGVTMFIKYTLQENQVIRIEVFEGTNKP